MGQSFLKMEESDMAIKQFERALRDVKGMGDKAKQLHYNLGCAFQASADVDRALDEFEQILEHDVKYKDIRNRIKELKSAS
jgi:tetratricopeptide (TPR) repeat protein